MLKFGHGSPATSRCQLGMYSRTGHVIDCVCLQLRQLTHLGVDLEMREMLLDSLLLLPLPLDQVMQSSLLIVSFSLLPFAFYLLLLRLPLVQVMHSPVHLLVLLFAFFCCLPSPLAVCFLPVAI